MGEVFPGEEQKQGGSKKLITWVLIAILIIGGSVAAYSLFLNTSTKEKYFLSEKKSFEFMTDTFKERYKPELDWLKVTEEKPNESTLTLSAEYNDPYGGDSLGGPMNAAQIINNSTLTITTASDMDKKLLSSNIKGSFGGIEVGDINVSLTSEKIMFGLPFLEELLQINGDDIGKLLHEVDPVSFSGEESFDLNALFDKSNGLLSKEDQEHIKKEYVEMVYEAIPESAFKSEDESVDVNGDSVKAEKITFHLTEKELKDILSSIFEKMEKDDTLKEIIKDQYQIQQFGGGLTLPNITPAIEEETNQFINDFETAMKEANEGLSNLLIPDGFTSTIWINDELIVKRNFSLNIGPSEEELVTLTIDGTQLLTDSNQSFDYNFAFEDAYDQGEMTITGDLENKDNEIKDSIKLAVDQVELAYEGTETLSDNKRDFERVFSINDSGFGGSLVWSGNASYDQDKMNSEHQLSVESPEINQDMFTLHLAVDAKTTKSVEMPSEDNVKDIGTMSMDELIQYFDSEVAPQFQEWLFGLMGPGSW